MKEKSLFYFFKKRTFSSWKTENEICVEETNEENIS